MNPKLKPLCGRVIVEPLEEKETVVGGIIIIPETAKEKTSQAGVVALCCNTVASWRVPTNDCRSRLL
jgi:co-chaperonin GroES (HSP10)